MYINNIHIGIVNLQLVLFLETLDSSSKYSFYERTDKNPPLFSFYFTGFPRRPKGNIFQLFTFMLSQGTPTSFRPFRCNKLLLLRFRELRRPPPTKRHHLNMRTYLPPMLWLKGKGRNRVARALHRFCYPASC